MKVEDIPLEPDRTEGWAIQYVVLGTVITILLCGIVVWLFQHGTLAGGGRTSPVELHTVPPASPFVAPTPVELERQAEKVQLEHWQWADRAHQIVRLPVDRAIERYVQAHQGSATGLPPRKENE